ncbi:hypothetical protein ACHAXT_007502 [Thalassiosira profunda]
MPHYLCFADLRATKCSNDAAGDEGCTRATTSAAKENCRQPIALFRPEEGKKSSFVLQRPCALHSSSQINVAPNSSTRVAIDDDSADEDAESPPAPADEANDADECSFAANACKEKREPLTGEASITSQTSSGDNTPQLTPDCAREVFLFGGFELISNAKTIEVHVIRSNDAAAASENGTEEYMTTCKGIPARDLEPVGAPISYVDGNSTGSNGRRQIQDDALVNTGDCSFYKFILVSPGGPKPMKRVRLKFVQSSTPCEQGAIIVRSLKVKGRLSDSIPSSNASTQQSMSVTPPYPMGAASRSQEPMQSGAAGLASMLAMMGGKGAMGAPPMQMVPQQQQRAPMSMQTTNLMQPQMQHQQQSHELMSSIAGLGMFLKSSEERTMKRLESLINGLEMRTMKRLDGLEERLGAIEERLKSDAEPDDTEIK